jgi:ribokinase
MSREARIFVLGSFIVDLAFRCQGMPSNGETIRSDGFVMGPGGKGTNQAVAARRSGADVSLMTASGADHFSKLAEDFFESEQINTQYHHRFSDTSTGAAFIHIDSTTGENRIIVFIGANGSLTTAHAKAAEDKISGCSVFLTQLEQPVETALVGLEIARRHGVTTILNPAPALPLDRAMIGLCDIITPNETELASLTGMHVETDGEVQAAAEALKAMGAGNVVVTLGSRGAYILGSGMNDFIAPFVAPEVVDTAGAGDAFNGVMASALAFGASLDFAVARGCAAGALCVAMQGTAPAMPTTTRIDEFIGTQLASGNSVTATLANLQA